jgi:hypothetical protein
MTSNVSRSGNSAPASLPDNTDLGMETSGRGSNRTSANTAPQPAVSQAPNMNIESILSGLPPRCTSAGSANNQNGGQLDNALTNRYSFQQSNTTAPQLRQQRHPDNVLSDQYSSALQQSRATALPLPLHEMSHLRSGPSPESSPPGEMLHRDNRIDDILAARSLRSESQNLSDSVQVTPNSSPPTSSRDRSWDAAGLESPRDFSYGQE